MGKSKHGGHPVSAIRPQCAYQQQGYQRRIRDNTTADRRVRLFFEILHMVIFHTSTKNTKVAVGLQNLNTEV